MNTPHFFRFEPICIKKEVVYSLTVWKSLFGVKAVDVTGSLNLVSVLCSLVETAAIEAVPGVLFHGEENGCLLIRK